MQNERNSERLKKNKGYVQVSGYFMSTRVSRNKDKGGRREGQEKNKA